MSIKQTLEQELLKAMKEKDEIKRNVFRLALSMIKLAEVEKGNSLDDSATINILMKEIKTREETISEAKNAGRDEMVSYAQKEIDILRQFLPKEMEDDELTQIIKVEIAGSGASSLKEMGIVMKRVIEIVKGRASNDRISKIVRGLLEENK
jgi:uncharacterized protein YqeY